MHVLINSKSRQYVVDTTAGEIVERTGRGKPPSDATVEYMVREAQRAAKAGIKEITMPDARDLPAAKGITIAPPAPRVSTTPAHRDAGKTDDELMADMHARYDMFCRIVDGATYGEFPAVIVTGSAGMGKTETSTAILEKAFRDRDVKYSIVQGSNVSPITLYERLWKFRHKGNVLVMDDSDTLLNDSQGVMMLKAAMDSKPSRKMSWGTRASLEGDTPNEYDYQGSLIFLSNQNFRHIVNTGNPLHARIQHLSAITSRVNYLDLGMHSNHARYLWTVMQIKRHRILEKRGLTAQEQTDVMTFIRDHTEDLQEVSIRTAVKMVPFVLMARRDSSNDWRKAVRMMEFR